MFVMWVGLKNQTRALSACSTWPAKTSQTPWGQFKIITEYSLLVWRVSLHCCERWRRGGWGCSEEEDLCDEENDRGAVRHGDPQQSAPEKRVGHLTLLDVCSPDMLLLGKINCVAFCHQTPSSGHRAESSIVETSPGSAGDLQPPQREWPELLSGGENTKCCRKFYLSSGLP